MSHFDSVIQRLNLSRSMEVKPDEFMKKRKIAQSVNVFPGLVTAEHEKDYAVGEAMEVLDGHPVLQRKVREDSDFVRLAHDDFKQLAAIEHLTGLRRERERREQEEAAKNAPGFMHGSLREIGLHLKKIPRAIWQNMNDKQVQDLHYTMRMLEEHGELTPQMKARIERDIAVYGRQYEEASGQVAGINEQIATLQPRDLNWAQKVVRGAVTSAPHTLAALGITAATRNPAAGAAVMGASVSETATADARIDGLDYDDARYKGMVDGLAEGAFEIAPMLRIMKLFNRGGDVAQNTVKDILKAAGSATVSDMVGENATQLVQDANNLLHGLDAQWEEAIQKHGFFSPQALKIQGERQLLATGISALTSTAISSPVVLKQVHAHMRQEHAENLQTLQAAGEATRESRTRGRAPEEFYQLAEELEEFADYPHIYLDGNALADSGLTEALLQAAPEYAEAVQQAIDTGGSVQIKMADVLSKIAPEVQLFDNIREHVRFEPDGLSLRELQQNTESELSADVEEALAERTRQDEWQMQVQAIYDDTHAQLSRGGKFAPPAIDSYALLNSQFYSRFAQDLGITPLEAMRQHPLQVVNGEMQGGGYNQAVPSMGEMITVAKSKIRSLIQSIRSAPSKKQRFTDYLDVDGQAVQEASAYGLDIAGFKHVLDESAVTHVFKRHGEQTVETTRGQIAIQDSDFETIADVVSTPNKRIYGFKTKDGQDVIVSVKTLDDGTMAVVEEVRVGRKKLAVKTLRKHTAATDLDDVIETMRSYARSDGGHTNIQVVDVASNHNIIPPNGQEALYQDGQSPRGSYDPASATITLTPDANLSTFIHEFGHHALETTVAVATRLVREHNGGKALTQGEEKIVDQTAALLKSVALDLDAWNALSFGEKRPYHERIARTFETYMMTGQAPSAELQGAFARFKAWLFALYKNMRRLNAPLSDEVKQVFDRMLASDEAIEDMRRQRGLSPMFESAEEAGMTEEEYTAYREEWQQARDAGGAEMHQRSARDLKYIRHLRNRHLRKIQQEAKEVREAVEADVREQLAGQPVYIADEVLKRKPQENEPLLRLSGDALRTLGYGEVEIKALGRKVHKHGMHPRRTGGVYSG